MAEIGRALPREQLKLGPKLRRSDRILIPDAKGRRRHVSSYVHAMGMYFSIYRVRSGSTRRTA